MPYLSVINEPEEQKNDYFNNPLNQQCDNDIYYDAEEEYYSDARDYFIEPASPSSSGEIKSAASGESPAIAFPLRALVRRLVSKTLFSIQLRLFARLGGVEELYYELQNLAQSHKPLASRLPELRDILQRHAKWVPTHYQQVLCHATEFTIMGISLYRYANSPQESISAKLQSFARQAEHLLSLELVRNYIAVDELHRLELLTKHLHSAAHLLNLHQHIPEGISFNEWLQLLAQQEMLPVTVQEGVLKYNVFSARLRELGAEVGEINQLYPLPAEDDWASRINWAHQVLNDPATAGQLKTYLSPDLVAMVNISAPLVQLVSHFPTGNSLAKQLVWAGQQVMAPPPELRKLAALPPFSEFATSARRKLNDKSIDPGLLNALLALATPGPSLWNKSLNIISFYFTGNNLREAISSALRGAVHTYIPGGTLLGNAWDWYQTLPENLSWQETLERFTTDLQQTVCDNPHLLRAILPDYVLNSADALSALTHLPVGKSWKEILRWACSRLGKENDYDWLYHRYMELSLARGIYEALKQGDTEQRETVLRSIAESLKAYLALRPDSGLRDLLDLLPYLPLLAGIREDIIVMPGNDTWLGLSCNLLKVLAKNSHPALTELRLRLETQIVDFLSDSMLGGIDAIWEQLPDDPLRFPGAEAVPVPAKNDISPEIFWDQQQMLDESNLAERGSKNAQTEATSEETQAHGGAEYEEFVFSFQQQDQLLDELLAIVDEYEKDPDSVRINDNVPLFPDSFICGGLTAGWLTTLFLFWRAYRQTAPGRSGEEDIEMQELRPQAIAETVVSHNAEDGLLPTYPRPAPSVNKKRYLVPSLLLSVMSGATAWAAWKKWGEEKPLTLQQVFREALVEEGCTALSEIAPVALPQITPYALPQITPYALPQISPAASKSHTRNIRSVAENNTVSIYHLRPVFSLWNTTSNKETDAIINHFEKKLKSKGMEEQKISLLLIELIDYILINMKVMIDSTTAKYESTQEYIKLTTDNITSLLVFMDKAVGKVEIMRPELHFKNKTESSAEYKYVKKSLIENLSSKYFNTQDNYYSNGYFHEQVYKKVQGYIDEYHPGIKNDKDIIDNKKNALIYYQYIIKSHDNDKGLHLGKYEPITYEALELISNVGLRIIDILSSTTDHDKLIEKAQSEIGKNTFQTTQPKKCSWDKYHDAWKKYGRSSFDIIRSYVIKYDEREGSNLYLRGCTEAINELIKARGDIINQLLYNFTRPEDVNQQCALYFLLSRQINKISEHQYESNKILQVASEILSDDNVFSLIKRLNNEDFGFKSILDDIKVDTISKIAKKIEKKLTREESIEYYDVIMNDTASTTLPLRESIQDHIKITQYLLYLYLSRNDRKIDNILRNLDLKHFNKIDISTIEEEALSYLIAPSPKERYTPLMQVNCEANNYSTTGEQFYNLYNRYIRNDSIYEAKHDVLNIISLYKNNIDKYQDVFEKPKSVDEYKISYYINVEVSLPRKKMVPFLSRDIGSIKIITLSDNKKYVVSTLSEFPSIIKYNKEINGDFNLSGKTNIEDVINYIYGDDTSQHLKGVKEKFNKITKQVIFIPGNISETHFSSKRIDKSKSIKKPIKDILHDSMRDMYVKIATNLREKGNKSPPEYIMDLIPFYAVIKRSLNDSEYHPTISDMAWDIVDLSVSLALVGTKKIYDITKIVTTILTTAENSLYSTGKLLNGTERYLAIITLATPEIIKKIPSMSRVLKGAAKFTTETLNPLGPLTFLGSKAFSMGRSAIKKIPKRGNRTGNFDASSSSVQKNKMSSTGSADAFGTGIYKDLKYIDEMTDGEILAAKKQLPADFLSDPTLTSLAKKPDENCFGAAQRIIEMLSPHGYDTRIIGALFYKNASDIMPLNHYSVIAKKNDFELVIDVTFDQFISTTGRKQEWVITSWEEWCRKMTSSDKLQNKLIITKEYKNLSDADAEIHFSKNLNYLSSPYIKDPEFHILLMPRFFARNINAIYTKDVKLISTPKGIMKLTLIDESIINERKKLCDLRTKESKFIEECKDVPVSLSDDIVKTVRLIDELDTLKLLPERIDNYLYINKNNFIIQEGKLYVETPVSYKLHEIFENDEVSSINNINDITSMNDKGLALINDRHFITHNEKMYPVTLHSGSENKATLLADNYTINIEHTKFKWEIVEKTLKFTESKFIDAFRHSSTSPLHSRGLLNVSKNTAIETPFDVIRLDKEVSMSEVKTFSPTELQGDLRGKISTATGDKLSSQTITGPVLGKWKQGEMSNSVDFIHIKNGSSGCVGIRIPFDQLSVDRPVIVSSGALSGCTMIYATDDNYFYAFHTGQRSGDTNWLTSQQGVDDIYKTHLALKGTTIPSLTGKKLTNEDLPTIFSEYQSSLITYLGKNSIDTGNTRILQQPWSTVNIFDYNKSLPNLKQSRVGMAYAVLSKTGTKANVVAYSEDFTINIKSKKFQTLSSCHQLLQGHTPTAKESIFKTNIDTLQDIYNSFVSVRTYNGILNTIKNKNTDSELPKKTTGI